MLSSKQVQAALRQQEEKIDVLIKGNRLKRIPYAKLDGEMTYLTQAKLCGSNFSQVEFIGTTLNEAQLNQGIFKNTFFSLVQCGTLI